MAHLIPALKKQVGVWVSGQPGLHRPCPKEESRMCFYIQKQITSAFKPLSCLSSSVSLFVIPEVITTAPNFAFVTLFKHTLQMCVALNYLWFRFTGEAGVMWPQSILTVVKSFVVGHFQSSSIFLFMVVFFFLTRMFTHPQLYLLTPPFTF